MRGFETTVIRTFSIFHFLSFFRSLSQYAPGPLCIAIDLEPQVRSLKEELSKATALSAAGAAVASAADSARSAAPPSPMPDALDTKTKITVFGASAVGAAAAAVAAADTISDTKQGIDRSGSVEAWVSASGDGGDDFSPAERKARELENAEKELQNLREREQDAKGEAERMADELQRARCVANGFIHRAGLTIPTRAGNCSPSNLHFLSHAFAG